MDMLFRGTATALVTPFTDAGDLDIPALRSLITFQIDGGIDALVVLGTTGENPTVTPDERVMIVETAMEAVAGRIPVVVGTGTNGTRSSVANARQAARAGASAQLVVAPYYNKPSQEGVAAHVAEIASATDCPIILYNVPGRTGVNISADNVLRMAEDIPSVIAVKEASGSLSQISDILHGRKDGFALYSGDDELTLPVLSLGGDGVISVIANAVPLWFGEMVRAALSGNVDRARRLHFALLDAMRACFLETNPVPIKAVLAERGLASSAVRLPLLGASPATRRVAITAFKTLLDVPA